MDAATGDIEHHVPPVGQRTAVLVISAYASGVAFAAAAAALVAAARGKPFAALRLPRFSGKLMVRDNNNPADKERRRANSRKGGTKGAGSKKAGAGRVAGGKRRSWPEGTELGRCPNCGAEGAVGKAHNILGVRPYKRCGLYLSGEELLRQMEEGDV